MMLVNPRFTPLPLKNIQPAGWLKAQLETQLEGLSGHLDLIWPDIHSSRWLGGDQEGWERLPYWLDGALPLAHLTGAHDLIRRIDGYIDYIIDHQGDDGWLGPREMSNTLDIVPYQFHDVWSQFLMCKVLTQQFDLNGDGRVLAAVEKNLRCLAERTGAHPLFNWGQFRWFEALLTVFWLYERKPQDWLLDLAVTLHAQGFDWKAYFARWPWSQPTPTGRWNFMSHVVNNAMAVKAGALLYRLSGDQSDVETVYHMIDLLERHHGATAGIFSGDECLAGKSPTQGTELCAVVEYAFSLEVLLSIMGDPLFADKLEKVVFNALPAAFLPDMWSHQYDQQINQVECSIKPRNWTTNFPDANIYGLEPNYGCCTANFSQGWPKFAASLWMSVARAGENAGLALWSYSPCRVTHSIQGKAVVVDVQTDYPFSGTVVLSLTMDERLTFPLYLRIPGWADGASYQVNDARVCSVPPGMLSVIEREWSSGDTIRLSLPMQAQRTQHEDGSISIERGPLVYSLKIAEELRPVNSDHPLQQERQMDWEVYPLSDWNYAIKADVDTLSTDVIFEEKPPGLLPFSPNGAPVTARLRGKRVPGWQMQDNSAGEIPAAPLETEDNWVDLELIPYGCTNLRITQFPVIKASPKE